MNFRLLTPILAVACVAGMAGASSCRAGGDAGTGLRIEAYAWRDFMPVSPPGGKPLAVVVRVLGEANGPVRILRIRVRHDTQTWTAQPEPRAPSVAGTVAEAVARGGPTWTPGSIVEVETDVEGPGGVHWTLRAPPIAIAATH